MRIVRWESIRNFLRSEDGPTAVEYAVLLALMGIASLAAIQTVGRNSTTAFGRVARLVGS